MKKLLPVLLSLAMLALPLSGCKGGEGPSGSAVTVSGSVDKNGNWIPDTSKTIKIELMEKGWVNTPTKGDASDPYWSWMKENFNIELSLTNTSEFSTSLMVRFASQNPPDIIAFDSADNLRTLYNQGVMINDWNPYLEYMPTVDGNIGEMARRVFTQDGKLIVLPGKEVQNTYGFRIRGDWLKKLKLDMPTDVESLLEVARAFTFNDPDGNGKNDTYAFSSAGSGTTVGEIGNLLMMWGHPGFHITQDGKVSHPVVNGNLEKFLKFMKNVSDEKLIDPDWFIQGWEQRKGQMYRGSYGILWYTGALITEMEYNNGMTGVTADQWVTLPMPKASEGGGKQVKGDIASYIVSVSAKAAKDADKLARIIYFIEQVTYPNDGFYKLRYGDGFDYYFDDLLIDGEKTGYKYLSEKNKGLEHYRSEKGVMGSADYGTWIDVDVFRVVHSIFAPGSKTLATQIRLEEDIINAGTYADDDHVLVLDAQTVSDASTIQNEFLINYILGYENDYGDFKNRWLQGGGKALIEQATEQFKAYGLLP